MERSVEIVDEQTSDPRPPTCAVCGITAADDGTWRLTWTVGIERDREVRTCERCSREHLRSIEAMLDSDWW